MACPLVFLFFWFFSGHYFISLQLGSYQGTQSLPPGTLGVVSDCHEEGWHNLKGWGRLQGQLQAGSHVPVPSLSRAAAVG